MAQARRLAGLLLFSDQRPSLATDSVPDREGSLFEVIDERAIGLAIVPELGLIWLLQSAGPYYLKRTDVPCLTCFFSETTGSSH